MVNIVVARQKPINISSNSAGLITTTSVTVKNNPSIATGGTGGSSSFDTLEDVDASGEVDGAVPVYDSVTGKYVVKRYDLDGGEF